MSDLKAPKHLKPETQKWWLSVCETYELEEHHVRLLTLASEAWDRITQAREALKKHGTTYLDRFKQPRARPEVKIELDNRIAFTRLLRELALDVNEPETPRTSKIHGKAGLRR